MVGNPVIDLLLEDNGTEERRIVESKGCFTNIKLVAKSGKKYTLCYMDVDCAMVYDNKTGEIGFICKEEFIKIFRVDMESETA